MNYGELMKEIDKLKEKERHCLMLITEGLGCEPAWSALSTGELCIIIKDSQSEEMFWRASMVVYPNETPCLNCWFDGMGIEDCTHLL